MADEMQHSVQWGSGNPASGRCQRGVEGIRDHPKSQNQAHLNQREALGRQDPGRRLLPEGASVAQWYNTYLLDYWLPVQSRPAAVHFSHKKKDVLAMMVIDSSMEVCPVLLVPQKYK